MSIEGSVVAAHASLIVFCGTALLAGKAAIVFILLKTTGSTARGAVEAAGALTPAGEFSFVVFPLAAAQGMMTPTQAEFLSALAALTMFMGPIFAKLLSYGADRQKTQQPEHEPELIPDDDKNSILVIGFSRFAQIALQVLLAEDVNVTVIDNSVERIRNAARFGFKVYYGDGTRLDVLRAAGAADALVIAVCVDRKAAVQIVEMAKANFPLARVHARAFDRIHAIELLERGADYEIRETFESALVFGGATLNYLLDNPAHVEEVVAFVRRRDEARFEYQLARGSADGLKPVPADILPEPLFKPLKKTRALSQESQDIVEGHDVGL